MHLIHGWAFVLSRTLVTTGQKAQLVSSSRLCHTDWLWARDAAVGRSSAKCNWTAEVCAHGKVWTHLSALFCTGLCTWGGLTENPKTHPCWPDLRWLQTSRSAAALASCHLQFLHDHMTMSWCLSGVTAQKSLQSEIWSNPAPRGPHGYGQQRTFLNQSHQYSSELWLPWANLVSRYSIKT